jgi:membrane fusion protein, multidrug efflux system
MVAVEDPRMKQPLLILPALLAALMLGACSKPEPAPEPVRAVRTMTVTADTAGGQHEYAAEVRARVESRLGFRVGGKMLRRSAEVGQRVKAGAVLAELDPQDLRLGQDAAGAAVKSARVNLDIVSAELKRYKELRDQGFISSLELERREATVRSAQAAFDQAQAQASVQGNQASYSTLRATTAGVITAVEAEAGAVLAAGTPVLRLAHDGPRDVVFAVPEDAAASLRALIGAEGKLRVRLWGSNETLPATLREVAAAADPATRTFLAKADLGDAPVQLGQTAAVLIDLPKMAGVAKLPLSAVLQQQGKTSVWLVDKQSMTVKVQPVTVAGADGNSVIIAGGVNPGQEVVTAGVHMLTPGQKVRLYLPNGAAAASAPADSR